MENTVNWTAFLKELTQVFETAQNEQEFEGGTNNLIKKHNPSPELIELAKMQCKLAMATLKKVEKLEMKVQFHQTVQNMAKIIETQYELNYILPIMGEMIDKFIYSHLTYIFLKVRNKKEYKLIWPVNCSNGNIVEHLKKLTAKTDKLLLEDGKMGIFPLHCDGKLIGGIVSYNPFEKLTNAEIEYLLRLCEQASSTVDRANSYMKVLKDATLDALTGLNNRRQFEYRLKQEVSTAKRKNTPLCCMMIDVDHFKAVNDTYGHAAGDAVLKQVAMMIKKEIREYDIASRYGGEEFNVIFPNTSTDEALIIADRLREEISKNRVNIEEWAPEQKEITVTISIGISAWNKDKPQPELMYQDADKALYEAKRSGRNKVVVFEQV
jgi:diguanylate cyclase (GGDEF)-like protein